MFMESSESFSSLDEEDELGIRCIRYVICGEKNISLLMQKSRESTVSLVVVEKFFPCRHIL